MVIVIGTIYKQGRKEWLTKHLAEAIEYIRPDYEGFKKWVKEHSLLYKCSVIIKTQKIMPLQSFMSMLP